MHLTATCLYDIISKYRIQDCHDHNLLKLKNLYLYIYHKNVLFSMNAETSII